MENTSFVIVDIETTGLSRFQDKITEFCGVKVNWDEKAQAFNVLDELATLVNPLIRIPRFISRLTGITNHMVDDAPVFGDVAADVQDFIGDDVIVAHNAVFDYNFIDYNLKTCELLGLSNIALCTCKLSRRLIPGLSSYRLESVCNHFSIENQQVHRAMGDVMATRDVFGRLYQSMKQRDISSFDDVVRFQKSRIVKS